MCLQKEQNEKCMVKLTFNFFMMSALNLCPNVSIIDNLKIS